MHSNHPRNRVFQSKCQWLIRWITYHHHCQLHLMCEWTSYTIVSATLWVCLDITLGLLWICMVDATEQDLDSRKYLKERFLRNFQFFQFSPIFKLVDCAKSLEFPFWWLNVNSDKIPFHLIGRTIWFSNKIRISCLKPRSQKLQRWPKTWKLYFFRKPYSATYQMKGNYVRINILLSKY